MTSETPITQVAPMPALVEQHIDAGLQTINDTCADPLLRAKLRGLLRGYDARWGTQKLTALEIEVTVTSDLYNPATSAKSRSFTMAGKKDLLMEEDGHLWLMDHKTCSEDIADPNAAYWRQLTVEGQHLHYALLEHLNGRRVDGAVWDVTRKPSISPRQISKADMSDLAATKRYFGMDLTNEQIAEVRETGRESYDLYEYRLAWDATRIRPEWYFQRQRIARMDNNLVEYAEELWGHTQDLLIARRENRWPRNSGACMNYGRACKFLGICSGQDSPDSDKWKKKEWVHNELPIFGEDSGNGVLTNSRIRCFQTCRRKHYYEYELGIDRSEPEEIESLYLGTLWHAALETYFKPYLLKAGN